MPNRLISIFHPFFAIFGVAASLFANSLAVANDEIPSHCQKEEFKFLNARIPLDGTNETEKILSLCADRKSEPLARMIYRFGAIGKVEMELIASAQNKAGVSRQSDESSRAGFISVVFYHGPYVYEVSEGMGMTSGIRLNVYRNTAKIIGYESHEFGSELIYLNFDQTLSPIFKLVTPLQPW
jgi:hypothetical protein